MIERAKDALVELQRLDDQQVILAAVTAAVSGSPPPSQTRWSLLSLV